MVPCRNHNDWLYACPPPPEKNLTALENQKNGGLEIGETEHDFGLVLARGEVLKHDFALRNPTDRPIRLLEAQAFTPCCSSIGPLPPLIGPGEAVHVPAVFRTGRESVRKRVEFAVWTDAPEAPVWTLGLTTAMTAEVELHYAKGSDTALPLGQSGLQRLLILCRRVGSDGRGAPETVVAAPPLSADFAGPAAEENLPGGLVEARRIVEVHLPASPEEGMRRGEVVLGWPGCQRWPQPVEWRVTPRVRAIPSSLVLDPGTGTDRERRTVVLESVERPFRITGVSGPLLADPPAPLPAAAGRKHRLDLAFDVAKATRPSSSNVKIATDHPDQRSVEITVLVMGSVKGVQQ